MHSCGLWLAFLTLLQNIYALPSEQWGPPHHGPGHDGPGHHEPFFFKGFDLSSLKILEDGGAVYKDTAKGNATRPVEDILGDGEMNVVRLRLWVNPTVPYDGGCMPKTPFKSHESLADCDNQTTRRTIWTTPWA